MAVDGQRNAPLFNDEDRRDISAVSLSVRSDTVDEATRSVEAVLATENMVPVFDLARFEVIDEILLMDGMREIDSVPLLNDHRKLSLDDVFGSVRNISINKSELICRVYIADLMSIENDDEAKRVERAWLKVKQKHQRNVSVGYRIFAAVMIEPGKTETVQGRQYTAGQRPLRVATDWIPREGSLTVINADAEARTRNEDFGKMKKKLRDFLVKLGMRSNATEQEAWNYYHDLDENNRAEAEQLLEGARPLARSALPDGNDDGEGDTSTSNGGTVTSGQRNEPPVTTTDGQRQEPAVDVQAAIRDERSRVSAIRNLFGEDEPDLMTRAIDEGWTPEQASAELLPAIRRRQASPVDNGGGHVGIHSRGSSDITIEALQGAVYLAHAQPTDERSSIALDNEHFRSATAMAMQLPQWLRSPVNTDEFQRTAEQAHRMAGLSMVDICRHAMSLNNVRDIPQDYHELAQRAISSGSLEPIFTTSMHARVLSSYMDTIDTTTAFTSEEDVANFKSNERSSMGKHGKLTRHARGGAPDHDDLDATKEEYRVKRYSKKFILDEMDIIDDTFGALNEFSPEDLGSASRQLRPDLVYSSLLANANLNATGAALFTTGQNNLFTGAGSALGIPTLETAVSNMGDQRIRDRAINIQPRFLVVPPALQFLAARILGSPEVRDDAGTVGRYGLSNPVANLNMRHIVDTRISAAGVVDPIDDTLRAGSATNWFLMARPGENGAKTIVVGYLRGSGRGPRISPFRSDGENGWYLGWSIKMDIGVKPLDFRCMQKHNGS